MSDLDRHIWHALLGTQRGFASGAGDAVRLDPAIGPFAAVREDNESCMADLATLTADGEQVILLQKDAALAVPMFEVAMTAAGVQMTLDEFRPTSDPETTIVRLGETDVADMLELAGLSEPGPFGERTHEIGDFHGIRDAGRLVAMAGTRFRLGSFVEICAVCTHPQVRGRGYATVLSSHLTQLILDSGRLPFLHAWAGNRGAISLYGRLGFSIRQEMVVTVLKRVEVSVRLEP